MRTSEPGLLRLCSKLHQQCVIQVPHAEVSKKAAEFGGGLLLQEPTNEQPMLVNRLQRLKSLQNKQPLQSIPEEPQRQTHSMKQKRPLTDEAESSSLELSLEAEDRIKQSKEASTSGRSARLSIAFA